MNEHAPVSVIHENKDRTHDARSLANKGAKDCR